MLTIGPGRDEALGINADLVIKRIQRNSKSVAPLLEELAMYVAEGRGMTSGYTFNSGVELTHWLTEVGEFFLAGLQEKGVLAKRLLKTNTKPEAEDVHPGQYL